MRLRSTVLQAVYDLLGTPNPDDPLVASIVRYNHHEGGWALAHVLLFQADQYRTDRPSFDKTVKEYITRVSPMQLCFWRNVVKIADYPHDPVR